MMKIVVCVTIEGLQGAPKIGDKVAMEAFDCSEYGRSH